MVRGRECLGLHGCRQGATVKEQGDSTSKKTGQVASIPVWEKKAESSCAREGQGVGRKRSVEGPSRGRVT